jgi:hypothetical protein
MKWIGPDTVPENVPNESDGTAVSQQPLYAPQGRNGIDPVKRRRADDEIETLFRSFQFFEGSFHHFELFLVQSIAKKLG